MLCHSRSQFFSALLPLWLVISLPFPAASLAEEGSPSEPEPSAPVGSPAPARALREEAGGDEGFFVHFQSTVASQFHPTFSARYSGQNSMQTGEQWASSVVTDLFTGLRLWKGGQLYFNPLLSGGRGLSSTLGVAAFPSGEVYRVGDPAPTVLVGRLFLRQVIGLGGGAVPIESGPIQLAGQHDRDSLTLTLGKVTTTDFVDSNPVSNDPHTGFMSWGLWASGAYDYPADTRGYTFGAAADLTMGWWSVRAGTFLEPTTANGDNMQFDYFKARGLVAEFEGRYVLGGLPGGARILVFVNTADMGSYAEALTASPLAPDVTKTRVQGRTKYGFAASANQDLGNGLSAFLRLSYDDGHTETWAFTEIDRSVAGGLVQSGSRWGRPGDAAGVGLVVSGLSDLHRRYLAAGGYGFIIGDGALSYAPETLAELYYRVAVTQEVSAGVNYQPIFNPAYNSARGPIQVFTGRVHVAF